MRKIYLLISQTGTLFKIIKWYTKHPYNHSAISTDKYFPFLVFCKKIWRLPFRAALLKRNLTGTCIPDTDCVVKLLRWKMKRPKSGCDFDKQQTVKGTATIIQRFFYRFGGKESIQKQKNLRGICSVFLSESDIHAFEKQLQIVHPMDVLNDFQPKHNL